MDPMKPVCDEPNKITMPSLKETLKKDIEILDGYFDSIDGTGDKESLAALSWVNVRESAISFADIFDNMESLQFKGGTK